MNRLRSRQCLGIMATELPRTLPFANSGYYRKLCLLGKKYSIEVFVFSPNRINWNEETVRGYTYDQEKGEWIMNFYPLPPLIYDRCFSTARREYKQYRIQVQRLRARTDIRFLGHGLTGKWEVMQMLQTNSSLHPFLPQTKLYSGGSALLDWLDSKQEAFLKPQGGSQGRGVLHVTAPKDASGIYEAAGRNGNNHPVHFQSRQRSAFKQWVANFIGSRPYLIQEYLSLHTGTGIAYDIRSLVQKNGQGRWQTTGMAIRCGQPGSVTSNLHGGGSAQELMPFLQQEFGAAKAEELYHTLAKLSDEIPLVLESLHGNLAELGIDFGIDRDAKIWILEVNSKPGRTVFKHMVDQKARRLSLANPIRYAGYLLQTAPPGRKLTKKPDFLRKAQPMLT
jgi:glutathione synthase/RimK-type ligase-like ATP-grasp enzyme